MPHNSASQESMAPIMALSILGGSELAQFADEDGSNADVAYFVARASFATPPLNFTAHDIVVENGEAPTQELLKGHCK